MCAIRRQITPSCWVDFYDTWFFQGKLRRMVGPGRSREIGASLIVGPRAHVKLLGQRGEKPFEIKIGPNRVIADVSKLSKGVKFVEAVVKEE